MQKGIMGTFETFLKIATGNLELSKFLTKATDAGKKIEQTVYKNGRTVFNYNDVKTGKNFFSISPNGVVKEGNVLKGMNGGKKTFLANVEYHGGPREWAAGETYIINSANKAGNININGGNPVAAKLFNGNQTPIRVNANVGYTSYPVGQGNATYRMAI